MKLHLSFSPCPNDTFMFEALYNKRIDMKGNDFEVSLHDIEVLNKNAFKHIPDITKVSVAAYPGMSDHYQILDSGSALGDNNGPLLISKEKYSPQDIPQLSIAIPGFNTTANMLLSIAYPDAGKKKEFLFSDIENAVLKSETDAGLIIHENRFTYLKKGLLKILDLGEYWQHKFQKPIPLGVIVIKRELPDSIKQTINSLIRQSVEYAFQHPGESRSFVKCYARELEDDVIQKHIELYVNKYSVNLGDTGKEAIDFFYSKAQELNLIPDIIKPVYI